MDSFLTCKSYILFLSGVTIDDCIDSDDENIEFNEIPSEPIKENIDEFKESIDDLDIDLPSELDINTFDNIDLSKDFNKSKYYESPPKHYIDQKSWIKNTNLLCAYCHCNINGIPWPVPINHQKILIPENNHFPEYIISLASNKKINENDENLLFSSQTMKEVKAFQIHNILCCNILCVGNYIKKINDFKIINPKESIKMALMIYKDLTGKEIEEIPDQDLWIVMKQYCGNSGQSEQEYHDNNYGKELKMKAAFIS